jgi:uncharacterized protein YkwD
MRVAMLERRRPGAVLLLSAIIGVIGLALLFLSTPSTAAGDCTVSQSEISLDASEQDLLRQINDYRRQNGLTDLVASPTLNKAAAYLAGDMARRRVMSHTDSLGRGLDRLADCGYRYYPAGENVAYGTGNFGSAQTTFNSWRGSAGHNANMLNRSYKAAGIGRACNGSACFWALDLGGVVDGSAPVTSQQVVATQTVPQTTSYTPQTTYNNNYTYQYVTPTYYTQQTMPSTIQTQLRQMTYWVYSNGRWYGYNPYRLLGSDTSSNLSGLYYFFR